jgi:hypothetical protein
MSHLAGSTCGVCQQAIRGFSDGAYCPECEVPVHQRCARPPADGQGTGLCPRCGAPKERGAESVRRETTSHREMEISEAKRHLHRGLLFLIGGLGLTLVCTGAMGAGGIVIFTGFIFAGLGTVIAVARNWPKSAPAVKQFDEKDDYRELDPPRQSP